MVPETAISPSANARHIMPYALGCNPNAPLSGGQLNLVLREWIGFHSRLQGNFILPALFSSQMLWVDKVLFWTGFCALTDESARLRIGGFLCASFKPLAGESL